MSRYSNKTQWGQFIPLVSVFFFWGFVAAGNDILIPVFKKAFDLTQMESMIIQFCFYVAYTVGSLIYIMVSYLIKQDLVNKIGYKNGLITGLLISALGTLLFYPAANSRSYFLMVSGLFIVGLGFSLQQIVCNPLAIVLGPVKTGSQRLTLAGGINNFGTTIGPLVVSFAIFGSMSSDNINASIESVKIPYLVLGLAFVLVAGILKFSDIPDIIENTPKGAPLGEIDTSRKNAFAYPQLVLGMIAIFVYVGVEVATVSNIPAYLETHLGFETKSIAPYVSLYWASLMIGRWTGGVDAFDVSGGTKKILRFLAPYFAFLVFLLSTHLSGHDLRPFYIYPAIILVLIFADILSKGNPARMLLIFSSLGILALILGMLTEGYVSLYAFVSVGLFCSTLWPCIFALAINGLGKHTNQGSGLLIMMIMGGGVLSVIQGKIADSVNIKFSFIVGIMCFAYLVFYALASSSILRKQGIDLDTAKSDENNHSQ
ncbi:MAG: sugar MFS transporter [Bergeyella sp.]|nr:sugar MFS transporter [Bergeyella sp.]